MRLLVEGRHLDIADVVFAARLDRVDADDVADDLDLERVLDALAHDRQRDRGVDGTAHLLDRLLQCQAVDRLVIQMRDEVVGLDAGAGRRGVVDRRDDLDDAALHRHLDAKAAEFAAGLHLHVLEVLAVEIGGMGIERREHAVDGTLDQLLVVGLFDIVGAHAFEHVAEKVELLVETIGLRCGRMRL